MNVRLVEKAATQFAEDIVTLGAELSAQKLCFCRRSS